jgi:hypothetical protein
MHEIDPVGTVNVNCPDCQALWDTRVHALAATFAAQLEKDCPELGPGLRQKVIAAWFKTTAQ